MYNLSRSQPRTLQRGCSTKVIDPELENSNAPEVEICSFSSFSGRMIAGHRTPFAPASSMRGISPSSAKKRRGIPSFRKPRPKGATKRTENVSFDPTAAAEPIPRVLFGCSAHSRQKAGANGTRKTQPNLRTSRDGNSQVTALSREAWRRGGAENSWQGPTVEEHGIRPRVEGPHKAAGFALVKWMPRYWGT